MGKKRYLSLLTKQLVLFAFIFSFGFSGLSASVLEDAVDAAGAKLSNIFAATLEDAATDLVNQLYEKKISEKSKFEMVLEIVNFDSRQLDREGREIQSAIYSALQNRFAEAKIILISESLAGVSARTLKLSGTYRFRGKIIELELKAIDSTTSTLIAKANASYKNTKAVEKDLVLVLPIDAPSFSKKQAEIFSKVFRVELSRTQAFDMISSDAFDRADAEKIQEEYKCSKEECGTIIAEQLNANLVISTTYYKIEESNYYLTGSLKNIKTGETLVEELVEHDGNIGTLKMALGNLACLLSRTCGKEVPEPEAVSRPIAEPDPEPKPEPQKEPEAEPTKEKDTRFFLGVPTSYSISSGKTKRDFGDEQKWSDKITDIDEVSGWKIRWVPRGERDDFRFHLEVMTIDATQKTDDPDPLVYHHTVFNMGWGTTEGLIFGFGFGYVYSNILCDKCNIDSGSGFDYYLDIGYSTSKFGIAASFYWIDGSASDSSTETGNVSSKDYEWKARAGTISLIIGF